MSEELVQELKNRWYWLQDYIKDNYDAGSLSEEAYFAVERACWELKEKTLQLMENPQIRGIEFDFWVSTFQRVYEKLAELYIVGIIDHSRHVGIVTRIWNIQSTVWKIAGKEAVV